MTRLAALLLGAALAGGAQEQEIYDLLIKNGHVIDPGNGRNERLDVAVIGARIARVGRDLPAAQARNVVDAGGYYVTPGLIDIHAYLDPRGGALGLDPDHNTLRHGVTTAVDAGSTGWKNFEAFKQRVIDRAQVRLLAFLNIAASAGVGGEAGEPDVDGVVATAKKYPRQIVGIRVAVRDSRDWPALEAALQAAERFAGVVMASWQGKSAGDEPAAILKKLRPGDVFTHLYGRPSTVLDPAGKPRSDLFEARRRGVLFDVGHGATGFRFRIAAPALEQGFGPDTVSSGLDRDSVMLPGATLTNVMSKLLNLGMTLPQVIERATVQPARAIRRPELGTLNEGAEADIAVLALERGQFAFLDSGHARLNGNVRLRCALTVRAGKVVWDADGLDAEDWREAGPYSNFK
jgi:dihydroorotase